LLEKFVKKHAKKLNGSGSEVTRSLKFMLKNEGFSPQIINSFLGTE